VSEAEAAGEDESGVLLREAATVVEGLPSIRDVVRSPLYLGIHALAPGDSIQADHNASTGTTLELRLAGEVMHDGRNTLCLHITATVPPSAPRPRPAPAPPRTGRTPPLSMEALLGGVGPPATTTDTTTEPPSSSSLPSASDATEAEQPQPAVHREAVMISGHIQRIVFGRIYPAPGGHLPDCFRTVHAGPYRVRLMRLDASAAATASPSPDLSPKSPLSLSEAPAMASASGMRASMGSGMGALSPPSVLTHVAVDRVDALPPAGDVGWGGDSIRCRHLPAGEAVALWLTTQVKALQQVSFGPSEDSLTVSLHTTPAGRPEAATPAALPPLEDDPDVGDPGGGQPGPAPAEAEAEEERSYWIVELDVLRCGRVEGAAVVALDADDSQQSAGEAGVVVGDYRVEVTRQAAPTATSLPGSRGVDSSGGLLRCQYPMLLFHVQLKISRLGDDEVEEAAGSCFDFLDAL